MVVSINHSIIYIFWISIQRSELSIERGGVTMLTYVVEGIREGHKEIILVTSNIEKAKASIVIDGWGIEAWENDVHLYDISYYEEDGFIRTEVDHAPLL